MVLDLGCGAGRDAYLASRLVGADGFVIGVDMTAEQLAVARRRQDEQPKRFGLPRSNVDFRQGYIEDLAAMGIADNSVDVVISNCVINLSPEKQRVFAEVFRVLKPGGEFYFSDVFTGRRMPDKLRHDPVLREECMGGAMYIEDFRRLLRDLGCLDYRVVAKSRITIGNAEIEAPGGHGGFLFHDREGLQTRVLGRHMRGLWPGCLLPRDNSRSSFPLRARRPPIRSSPANPCWSVGNTAEQW